MISWQMMFKTRINNNMYSLFCLISALIVHALADPYEVVKTDNLTRNAIEPLHYITVYNNGTVNDRYKSYALAATVVITTSKKGILLLISCSKSLAVFLASPSSYNASEGSNVTFHCHINESGNILFWLVNDEFSHSSVNQNRSISLIKYMNVRSTLTILAHSWNDHVEIQCAYRSQQSRSINCSNEMVMCSAKAILRVQGLLPPPTNFNGQSLPNDLAIQLTWGAPQTLDLTGIDPDIIHYEISVFDNKTGESENFTALYTEYTYIVSHIHSTNLCQDLEFSVLALNIVGRGTKSTIHIAPREAPSVKLVNTENDMQVNAKIECTATCNSLLTWRLHTHNFIDDRNGRNWHEVVAINRSGNLCIEKIALISQWFAPSVNAVSVQCIAIYVCPTESCLRGICSSNIQDVFISELDNTVTVTNVEDSKAVDKTIIGLLCGSSVFLTALCLMVMLLAVLIARARIVRRQIRRCGGQSTHRRVMVDNPIYNQGSVPLYDIIPAETLKNSEMNNASTSSAFKTSPSTANAYYIDESPHSPSLTNSSSKNIHAPNVSFNHQDDAANDSGTVPSLECVKKINS